MSPKVLKIIPSDEKKAIKEDEGVRAENTDIALNFYIVYFGETPK